MAHIDEGVLQAYLDHEVQARAETEAHVRTCGSCSAELERMRSASSLFATAMHSMDVQVPAAAAVTPIAPIRPAFSATPVARRGHTWLSVPLARAAMLLLGFAAVASATIPGSPLRAWISDALRTAGVLEQEQSVASVVPEKPPAGPVEPANDVAALSIEPVDGRIRIILTTVSVNANVQVRMVESDRALVQATGAAAKARFVTGPGRIEMIGVDSGDIMIEMPTSVRDASVVADGRVLYPKD